MTEDGPFRLAERNANIEASGIRKFFELGLSMKNPIDLSIGQAHFDVPEISKQAAIDAIHDGRNRYTVTQGIPELREAIRERYADRFGNVDDDEVMVTCGVSGGLMLTFLALLNPGDEILIPDPYFVMYRHLAAMVGAKAVTYDTYPDFKVDSEKIRAAITPRTRLILTNSPSNPTGHAMSEQEARDVAKVADEHNIAVLSDEIYEEFIYEPRHVSPREFTQNCIVLSGASKHLGMPGWRMGWALAPKALADQMFVLQQFSFVCAPAPLQHGVLAGFGQDFSAHREEYRAKRDLVVEGLKDQFGVTPAGGAFYMFPRLPEGVDLGAFINACIERELLVVPGSACSDRATNFRICFAAEDEKLKCGIDILNEIAKDLG